MPAQRIEALKKRLEGLKRALELFDSEQPAITELSRASIRAENGFPHTQAAAVPPTGGPKGVGTQAQAARHSGQIQDCS